MLGVRLERIRPEKLQLLGTRYRGGMKVVGIRPGSPAQATGIQPGDILVGILGWETISHENVAYVLKSDEFSNEKSAKFYIVRGKETLFGHIDVVR